MPMRVAIRFVRFPFLIRQRSATGTPVCVGNAMVGLAEDCDRPDSVELTYFRDVENLPQGIGDPVSHHARRSQRHRVAHRCGVPLAIGLLVMQL
jgi:hypothetical protein